MSEVFFTSDLHFGHNNIIMYEKRPFENVREMNEALIKNWNNTVQKEDTVFCLGDVSFRGNEETKELVSRLQGNKVLIMGNHDKERGIAFWYEAGFKEVYKYPILYKDYIMLSHEPPKYTNSFMPYFWMYGHVHGSEMYKTITRESACVCVERWDYKPVSLSKISELAKMMF